MVNFRATHCSLYKPGTSLFITNEAMESGLCDVISKREGLFPNVKVIVYEILLRFHFKWTFFFLGNPFKHSKLSQTQTHLYFWLVYKISL